MLFRVGRTAAYIQDRSLSCLIYCVTILDNDFNQKHEVIVNTIMNSFKRVIERRIIGHIVTILLQAQRSLSIKISMVIHGIS